jgi:hypothetical protein
VVGGVGVSVFGAVGASGLVEAQVGVAFAVFGADEHVLAALAAGD